MTPEFLSAVGAFVRRDWIIFRSYRTQLISVTVSGVVSLGLYYYLSRLVRTPTFPNPDDYFAFVLVGMIIFQVLQSTVAVSTSVRAELGGGTLERLILSPFGPVPAIASMMLFPFVFSMINAVITLALGVIIFGVHLRWETAVLGLPLAMLGAGTFAALGMLFAASTILFKRAASGLSFIMTLVALISGLYFPISLLPGWVAWTAQVQPFTPAVDLLRNVLVGTPLQHDPWSEVAKLVAFLVVMVPIGLTVVAAALRLGQRQGRILES